MTHRCFATSLVAAVVVLFCTGSASATRGGEGERRPPGSFAALYAARLGLDPEAQAQIQAIVAESGLRDEELRGAVHVAQRELHDLMQQTHRPEEAAVLAQVDAISVAEGEVHKNRLRAILAIREVLSPEQRAELLRLRDEEHPRRERDCREKAACEQDVADHCGAKRGRAVLGCLDSRWDQLSPPCRDALGFSPLADEREPSAP